MISIFEAANGCPRARRSTIVATSWIFVVAGILALVYAVYATIEGDTYQAVEIRRFEYFKPPPPRLLVEGDVIGEIKVARLGLKAIVVQGDSSRVLRHAVGHLSQTALPGETGNVALAAHRDTLFRPLRDIRLGDIVTFDIPGQQFRYQVDSTLVVSPSESDVLQPSTARKLTLITCFPFGYIGPAPNRFVVHAHEIVSSP